MQGRDVFVTGGTGYIGTRLIPALLARGHRVRALARSRPVDRVDLIRLRWIRGEATGIG